MNKSLNLSRAEGLLQDISRQDTVASCFSKSDCDLLHELARLGVPLIESSIGGYTLSPGPEALEPEKISDLLAEDIRNFVEEIDCLKIIDSTNTYLLQADLPQKGYRAATAECQLGGRGRRGNEWLSPYGRQLYLSVGYRLSALTGFEVIPLNVAIAVRDAFLALGYQNLGLKWPNDIYHNGHKLGGILVETGKDRMGWKLVIGIGLNVTYDQGLEQEVEQPITFLDSLGIDVQYSRNQIAAAVIGSIVSSVTSLIRGKELQERWRSADICQDQSVRVITESGDLFGTGAGIDEQGAFMLKMPGEELHFHSGEISLRLQSCGS